jgi:hypothetical protein
VGFVSVSSIKNANFANLKILDKIRNTKILQVSFLYTHKSQGCSKEENKFYESKFCLKLIVKTQLSVFIYIINTWVMCDENTTHCSRGLVIQIYRQR